VGREGPEVPGARAGGDPPEGGWGPAEDRCRLDPGEGRSGRNMAGAEGGSPGPAGIQRFL